MNILLLNTNPVVSRLLSLCIRDGDTVLEEVTAASAVQRDRYDIVFVDDASYVAEVEELLQRLLVRKKVCLAAKQSEDGLFDAFDEVITKPFLPSQLTAVLESISEEVKEEEEVSVPFIFPLSTDESQSEDLVVDETEESESEESTVEEPKEKVHEEDPVEEEDEALEIQESSEMILDSSEIERIKALLDEDEPEEEVLQLEDEEAYAARKVEVITEHLEEEGLEIIEENQIADILSRQSESENRSKSKKEKEKKKKKKSEKENEKKNDKKNKQQNEVSQTLEKALLKALEEMKPKKIKKLLKGAEVTIKINFKDEK